MGDLLSIGTSGVLAYRNAMSTVGENVANAETRGYARRETVFSENAANSGPNPIYLNSNAASGVDANSIRRSWDDFRAADARAALADSSSSDVRSRWLQVGESAIGDGDTGLAAKVTAVFTSADQLASNPGGDTPRRALLLSLQEAAGSIRASANGLVRTSDGITSDARANLESVNANLTALAVANKALARAVPGTSSQANLLDERDRLLDELAEATGATATIGDKGVATVTLPDGGTLVDGQIAGSLSLTAGANGTFTVQRSFDGTSGPATGLKGTLGGQFDAANVIAERRVALNNIAADFATQFNTWSATGRTPAGNPGAPIFSAGANATELAVSITNAADIAAAAPVGAANGNLLALQALRPNGIEGRLESLASTHAQATASARAEAAASATRRDNALTSRDDVSGIDLDREAADLIRFQQAYNASSKILLVARETMQTILDIF